MDADKLKELKSDFERDGYVFLPGFFSAGQIAEVNLKLQEFINEVVPGMPVNHVVYEDKENPETLNSCRTCRYTVLFSTP